MVQDVIDILTKSVIVRFPVVKNRYVETDHMYVLSEMESRAWQACL